MSGIEKVGVLIVDDEPVARRGIRKQLEAFPEAQVIGECANGFDAVDALRKLKPDLVFLDIQMPGLNGFDVVAEIGTENMPVVIFVTAYEEYALKAFEIHALDYILKPIEEARFGLAFKRAVKRLRQTQSSRFSERMQRALEQLGKVLNTHRENEYLKRIVIKEPGRIFFLDVEEISWIASAGNYVELHASNHIHLLRETMSNLDERMNPNDFVRISRSTIVNIKEIKEFRPHFKGEFEVFLNDGSRHKTGRSFRTKIEALINP